MTVFWLYVAIGVFLWCMFTPNANIRQHRLTPFRVMLWPIILVMAVRYAVRKVGKR